MKRLTLLLLIFFIPFSFLYDIGASPASLSDRELLNLVQKKCFNYFWNEANPQNGLVRDKAFNFKGGGDPVASIAAVGFALTAYPIGIQNKWISRAEGYYRTLKTLKFFRDHAPEEHGFFYHFLDMEEGKRAWNSEVSSIDTALFLAGALFAAEYFKGTEVEEIAHELYSRVDFPWMLNGGAALAMGWKPETGFLTPRWDSYNESMILYFLAIGSSRHPISARSWKAVKRKIMAYGPYILMASPPLFTHQYSHCWIDFRGKTDGEANYFKNSMNATLANRLFCLDQRNHYQTYSEHTWGLTASDGPAGYRAYGAEPGGAVHDGTVAPTAAISSIVFTPELSIQFARELYEKFRNKVWGRYGFADAFNFEPDWVSPYVLGIDQGPMLVMIENYKTGFVWNYFMRLSFVKRAMAKIGFRPGDKTLELPKPPSFQAPAKKFPLAIDGGLIEWEGLAAIELDSSRFMEYGVIESAKDLSGKFAFQWDEQCLYFACTVHDEQFVANQEHGDIHKEDLVELFIDPQNDGFRWKNKKDYQFGFSWERKSGRVKSWLWPHGYDPVGSSSVHASVKILPDGYTLEAAIPWALFEVTPQRGTKLRISPAIHDVDKNGSEAKLIWHFEKQNADSFALGEVVLTHNN
ncbi:MAG: hypothetical protein HY586_06440 [Candidatus Omnitrophica bacterium]|nr:hypothetical protein [Candidatus Omnitrophota bacterium]